MNQLYGLNDDDHKDAHESERRGMESIVYPVLAVAAVAICALLAAVLNEAIR